MLIFSTYIHSFQTINQLLLNLEQMTQTKLHGMLINLNSADPQHCWCIITVSYSVGGLKNYHTCMNFNLLMLMPCITMVQPMLQLIPIVITCKELWRTQHAWRLYTCEVTMRQPIPYTAIQMLCLPHTACVHLRGLCILHKNVNLTQILHHILPTVHKAND